MHRTLRLIAFLGLFAQGIGASAVESIVDGPKARFDDDLIADLVGPCALTRQIRGREVKNSVRSEWVLNHQFMQIHMKDVADPPAYEALALIGYSHADQRYVAHWCATYGGKFSAMGVGIRSGNSIEFRFDYPDGPFFNTFSWRPEEKRWVMRLETQEANGTRRLFALDTLRRP